MNQVVSLVIPVHGRVQALKATLHSIPDACDDVPYEIVIVSDGNTQTDVAIIQELVRNCHADLVVLPQAHGAAGARNTGAEKCTGEYIFFCDADIELQPESIKKLVNALQLNSAAAFAYGDYMLSDHVVMRGRNWDTEVLKKENYISTMSLVRRVVFLSTRFDTALSRFQDWDLWLSLAERGEQGVYVPGILFRVSAQGTISSWTPSCIIRHAEWFLWIPRVRAYVNARTTVLKKHRML